jgi:hypothetical protein
MFDGNMPPPSSGQGLFYHEDGSSMFLQNIGTYLSKKDKKR